MIERFASLIGGLVMFKHRTEPTADSCRLEGLLGSDLRGRWGNAMDETNDALWLAFETLAKRYPHDEGVRMTADLTRWLLEERQRLQLPVPPIIQKVAHMVIQELDAAAPAP
jgi:hypothetical protein